MADKILNPGESFKIEVNARVRINQSGVLLEETRKYAFKVLQIKEPWVDWFLPSKLTGYNFYIVKHFCKPRLKTANYYALCGGVMNELHEKFIIGEGMDVFSPERGGLFYAFANDYDTKWTYRNNRGIVLLEITCIN